MSPVHGGPMALKPCKEFGEQVRSTGRRSLRIEASQAAVAALVIAALGLPVAALAQALGLATLVAVEEPSVGGVIGAREGGDVVMHRLRAGQWTPAGWGLFATAAGKSMDLSTMKGWAEDPNAGP